MWVTEQLLDDDYSLTALVSPSLARLPVFYPYD